MVGVSDDRAPRPDPLEPKPENVPDELRELDQWVCWRYEWDTSRDPPEWTKVPLDAGKGGRASSTDSDTWTTFEEAVEYHERDDRRTDGIGFVVTSPGVIAGLDLDDCRDPETGDVEAWAGELLADTDTYAEWSPSGTGARLFGLAIIPDGGNRGDVDGAEGHLEMYDDARYLTVTGHHVENSPESVERVNDRIGEIHAEYIASDDDQDHSAEPVDAPGTDLDDEELLEKARNAENGDKFRRLYDRGDTSGYPSHSEARQALANLLAFWTGGDEKRMLRLFKNSDLIRGDDDVRTFENYEIPTALEGRTEFYDPSSADGDDRSVPDEIMPAEADGGVTTADAEGGVDTPASRLEPAAVKAVTGLGEDDSVSDLDDRQRAAAVWELVRRSREYHIRVRRDNGSLWAYDDGIWKPEGERALRHAARQALGNANYGQNVLGELKEQARATLAVEAEADEFGLNTGTVAVKNGLLYLDAAAEGDEDALRDLRPDDLALTQLPVEYDPEAEYDEWQDYVEEWAEDGRADALQEYVGYCLHIGGVPIHRALLLVGSGANGKGTFLHVVRALLGEENTSSIELQTLANERDAVAEFYGSLANIDDDLSARKLGSGLGMFKKLVGGDRVRARRLYEDGFEFDATGKHLYAANEVPDVDVSDGDEAFWRRWLLVEFPNHYPPNSDERENGLDDQLSEPESLSGVLNWAIQGWRRLLDQGHFTNEEHHAHEKRSRWQAWGDSVDNFIEECVEHDEDAARLTTGEAHDRYRAWCEANGEEPVGQQQFTIEMKKENVGYAESVRINGKVQRGYKALGFTDAVPDEKTGRASGQQSIESSTRGPPEEVYELLVDTLEEKDAVALSREELLAEAESVGMDRENADAGIGTAIERGDIIDHGDDLEPA